MESLISRAIILDDGECFVAFIDSTSILLAADCFSGLFVSPEGSETRFLLQTPPTLCTY